MKQEYLQVGKVTRPHGVMGEVQVEPWADSPQFLCQFQTLYVDEAHWPIKVERARVHKNVVILKLEGLTDVPSALSLKNAVLSIARSDVRLPPGQFFLADITGLEVRQADTDQVLGHIREVLTLPANNVYVVSGGPREMMIPAVPEFVVETNVDEGFIRVRLIEGL